ncbi:MAG: polysaccharide deacetylase family protein, partial [Pseudomonadota bacterium]|nr:polysaccharide deacetylase family protein [Pseudomonadota bacterium]
YDHRHVAMVKAAGFAGAVSTAAGASGSRDDVFQLRRFTPWDRTPLRFACRLGLNLAG